MPSFRKKGKVSVWIGQNRVAPGVDLLRDLCRVESYNLDDQEVSVDSENWRVQPVRKLLNSISYSSSFIDEALAAANVLEIDESLYVLCQFDFAYDPMKVGGEVSSDPIFLGYFSWDDSEDDEHVE